MITKEMVREFSKWFERTLDNQTSAQLQNRLGLSDVARLLGWDVGKVSTYREKGLIPSPVTTIEGYPLWHRNCIQDFASRKKITTRVVNIFNRREDFPMVDEAYVIGKGENGRFFFAWGPEYPYQEELPVWDIKDGESGISWHEREEGAQEDMQDAIDAVEEGETLYDLMVTCEDCGKEIYDSYWVECEPKQGDESVSCSSEKCENDIKYISDYDEADIYIGEEVKEMYPLEPDRWVRQVVSGHVWVKKSPTS